MSTWMSSWFSLEITREDFPWVVERRGPSVPDYIDA